MNISVGDKVRFLNEVGGGTVSRIEKNKLVYVLDEDGFEVPALINEVVLVEKKGGISVHEKETSSEPESKENYQFEESEDEGEPRMVLAFIADENISGNVKMYLINDSNFFAFYSIGRCNSNMIYNTYHGVIEPNTKIELDNLAINFLDGKEYECQLILYRKSIEYSRRNPLVETFKLTGAKLLKDNSYTSNDYFSDRAILVYLLKGEFEKKLDELSIKDVKKAVAQKEQKNKSPKHIKRDDKGILEVDLHIHELLDDTRGMSNKEILDYQMGKFHEIMNENKDKKNRKVVFIHGKGNGVLKSEIIKSLKRKYKWHSYQDASFKEYGFGATMVTI